MKVKVSCFGGYRTIDFPLSDSELQHQLKQIEESGIKPCCVLSEVYGTDNPLEGLRGKRVYLDEINFLAKRMDSLPEYENKVIAAYVKCKNMSYVGQLINLTYSLNGLTLLTDFTDSGKVGRQLCMDSNGGISETEMEQMDFDAYAWEILKGSQTIVLADGVLVAHGFSMQNVYNGKTFPACHGQRQ